MIGKSSLYLFIKQGIKNVLKFKIQFIIIITLTFLSTLMLTISLTVSNRLTNNYDQTMSKLEPFDYIQQKRVGIKNEGGLETTIVPISDFIENQYLRIIDSSDSLNFDKNYGIEYNVNLSSFTKEIKNNLEFNDKNSKYDYSTYQTTFITKTFEDPDVQEAFIEMVSDPYYYRSLFYYDYNPLTEEKTYTPNVYIEPNGDKKYLLRYTNDQLRDYLGSEYSDAFNDFIKVTIEEMKEQFLNDLKNNEDYLKLTPYTNLLKNNKISEADFNLDLLLEEHRNNNNFYNNYLYAALETVIFQINSMIIDYVTNYTNQAINQSKSLEKDDILKYFEEVIYKVAGFHWLTSNEKLNTRNENELEFAFTLFVYIFGTEYKGEKYRLNYSKIKNNSEHKINKMLVSYKNPPWIQVIDKTPDQEIDYKGKILTSKKDLYEFGARGSLTHIISPNTINHKITNTVDVSSNIKILKHENWTITNELGYHAKFDDLSSRNEVNFNSINQSKIYTLRNDILAEASNLEYQVRGETLLSDNVNEKTYRIVNLDYFWEEKLTIYEGNIPRTNNEILINAQYAKANKLKLGDNITLGNSDFVISGFASDPLTYYPVSELTVPIPNNKTSAIVYADYKVIKKMIDASQAKYSTTYYYNILTSKDNNKEENMALFMAYSKNHAKELVYSQELLKEKIFLSKSISYNDSLHIEKYKSFDSSPLSFNWKLTPMVLNAFNNFIYIACSIILIISFIAIVIAVKKTTELNSNEIATLKALGTKTNEIAISYLSYGIIIMIFIVPIAWILGSFLQEFITKLFLNYMGGEYNLAVFEFMPFLISFILFGILICIISYIVAIILNKKSVIQIFYKLENNKRIAWIDNFKNKLTSKSSFTTRFSAELAVSGFSKTLLIGSTIFMAGFLITTGLAVPGIVDNVVSSYYKNINYLNKVKYIEPIGNMPFAKTALSPWQGPDYYENYMIDTNNYFGNGIDQISDSVTQSGGINDTSVIPKILISNSADNGFKYNWFYDITANDLKNNNTEKNMILSIFGSVFGNNLNQLVGKGFSINDLQKNLDWIIHDSDSVYKNNEEQRKKDISNFSDLLTSGVPSILQQFLPNSSPIEGLLWKEQMLEMILSQTPSYIKNYVTLSENRFNQFEFGWMFYNYVPGVDNLYTQIDARLNSNNSLISLTGIQHNQTAFNIKNPKIFIDENNIKKIYDILYGILPKPNENIIVNDFKIYDAKNKTLNIPAIMNKEISLNSEFKNKQFNDLKFDASRVIISGTNYSIPSNAWMYDNTDWNKISKNKFNSSNFKWIPAHKIPTNKLTYAPIYDYKNITGYEKTKNAQKLINNSYGFIDIKQEIDQKTGILVASQPEIRPYYLYDNVTLFIPKEFEEKINTIIKLGNSTSNDWYGTIFEEQVPKITNNSWKKELGYSPKEYIWIKPYSLSFDSRYEKPNENLSGFETAQLTSNYKNFWQQSFLHKIKPFDIKEVELNWKNLSNGNIEKINIEKIANIDIYGSSLILVDQNLANLVHGYEIDKYIPFNYIYEDLSKPVYTYNANGMEIITYNKIKPKDLINKDNKNNWVYGRNDLQKSITPNMWFNGVYSNYKEPIAITTQASFSKSPKLGEYNVSGQNEFDTGVEIKEIQFLSQQQALVNQITGLILSISTLFISLIIIVSILTITMICDLYVNQYKKFMLVMKSLGYSNKEVLVYTFGFVSIFSLIAYAIGVGISYLAIFGIISYINNTLGVIPFGITWWSPILGTILIVVVFIISVLITTRKIRTESPTKLLA